MRFSLSPFLLPLVVCVASVFFVSCGEEEGELTRTSGFEDFIPQYNGYIKNWLSEQQEATRKAINEVQDKLAKAEGEEAEALQRELAALKREEEKYEFRLGLGDFFRFGDPSEIPDNLAWEDGMGEEEIGDPRAKKGGTFTLDMRSFPPTIRGFGDNSNNGFRSDIYDNIEMSLVTLHPKSMEMIPGLAEKWAVSEDGRTVYFKIDPAARYSDGVAVKASDFLFDSYIRISDDIVNPYAKQYWKENLAAMVAYDDQTLSISLPEAKIYAPITAGGLAPSPPHFYKDYGPDFTERYQWKFPPTTGAYVVKDEDIVKGVSITQTRVKDWWAKDKKYYKYRFNPDRIRHVVVRDESKAFELFRAGELDYMDVTRPEYWYEKSEVDPVFNGYIERYTFYNQYPAIPRGFYINVSKPLLKDRDVRIGIQHAMNWQKVIDVIFRGDYRRLDAFNQGFLLFSDPSIRARKFSISAAREAFARAGFTETDRNGFLMKEDGTKLSVSVTYAAIPIVDRMMAILKEEAKLAGFDLRLDSSEATVSYKKAAQKQHEMVFFGYLIGPPIPDYYQFLHSSNARDQKGNLKPQTNNLFAWAREDTDMLSEKVRFARTEEELRNAAVKLQNIMHEEAIFVPAYTVDFVRIACWRWVQWPDSKETHFAPPVAYIPTEAFVHWIDTDLKEETIAAKRVGKSFEEVNRIFDDYRGESAGEEEEVPEEETNEQPEEETPAEEEVSVE